MKLGWNVRKTMKMPELSRKIPIVGTRLHATHVDALPDITWLTEWCEHVFGYAETILIATDMVFHQPVKNLLHPYGERVQVILVQPWRSATFPLNVLVEHALYLGAKKILLQSSEFWVDSENVVNLSASLTPDTLVVGVRINEDHAVNMGSLPLDSNNSPWNTMALWNLEKLGKTGFLMVSSGLVGDVPGGMEEVTTISLHQSIDAENSLAKVINMPNVHWKCEWNDPKRLHFHKRKMASKKERAEQQLQFLGVSRGMVKILE